MQRAYVGDLLYVCAIKYRDGVLVEIPDHHAAVLKICLQDQVPFFWDGPGLLVVPGAYAGPVLSKLLGSGWEVLGLEGFELGSRSLAPRLDLIYDSQRSPQSVGEVLADWPTDVWVDFTVSDRR